VRYDRCPAQQRSLHAGKEGYPTLGFQFHCGHNRYVYYVSEAFPGARNDKAIVRFDTFLDDLVEKPELASYNYTLRTRSGGNDIWRGLWALCDGGYHKWAHTICGMKHADELEWKAWSGLCESTRKDVECVFGILKKRFQVLKNATLVADAASCEITIKMCTILHNMLLVRTGAAEHGGLEEHWKKVDDTEARSFGFHLPHLFATFTVGSMAVDDEEEDVDVGFDAKRQALLDHYVTELGEGNIDTLAPVNA